jgi:hypothetical protein
MESFDELAARVDQLRDQVSHTDESTQTLLRETIDAITEFNRRGLITLVQMLREDERGAEVLYQAVEAPEVMALFVSHGIIRTDRTLDVLQVFEQIRPHLIASSVEMSVEEVRDDIAYVKFPTGCSAPDQQTKDEIMGRAQAAGDWIARRRRGRTGAVDGVRLRRHPPGRPPVIHAYRAQGTAARPVRRLGAAAPGGLALPDASPTASHMYSPRGVWTDGRRVIAADSGNHRILIWHTFPDHDGAPADVVLGQPDFTSEGPAAGGGDTHRGLYLPTGVAVIEDRLVVAGRLAPPPVGVGWHAAHKFHGARPRDRAGGHGGGRAEPGRRPRPGHALLAVRLRVGRRGVLDRRHRKPASPGLAGRVAAGRASGRYPARPAGAVRTGGQQRWARGRHIPLAARDVRDERTLYVADAGDHRVLGFSPPGSSASSLVLGQQSAEVADEFKNRPQGPHRLRFPYAAVNDDSRLIVADTSNNRVLLWHGLPREGAWLPADTVLGQPDLDSNGENRWDSVADDSLCWPYGLSLAGDLLAVADSGNNRVVFWQVD